jgi:gamma-polyglutamate biosynthesis protein CapA
MTSKRRVLLFLFIIAASLVCALAFLNLTSATSKLDSEIGTVTELITSKNTENIETSSSSTRTFFLGDIQLGRDVERRLIKEGSDYPYRQLNIWNDEDAVFGNFESSVPSVHVPTKDNTFRFSTRVDFLPALRAAGVNHVSLANNHAFDYGALAFNNTLTELANVDIVAIGHPSTVSTSSIAFVKVGSYDVAVIALHTLYKYPTKSELVGVIEEAGKRSDVQVAYIHWGNEYQTDPGRQIREYAEVLVESGFDLIIGHHPHVVQSIESVSNVPVFYSLGNFIFDQYFSEGVQNGLVLELFESESKLGVKLHPVSSLENRNQPMVLEGIARENALEYLSSISSLELATSTRSGQITLD